MSINVMKVSTSTLPVTLLFSHEAFHFSFSFSTLLLPYSPDANRVSQLQKDKAVCTIKRQKMGFSAKLKAKSSNANNSSNNWCTVLLLVDFFLEDNRFINGKNKFFSSPSSSSSSLSKSRIRKSSNSNFITLLLFTLSIFEPTTISRTHPTSPR
ncbi:hypothetical protein I3842_09G115200 [Carya illinoinensis]|uniref:Uncharacterized protein n=1 Tax=Carya illinoinensis TaxID=32201 RepID=A0A922E4Q9_CARIL|nr:hypothetical protein I3842_09G115200 [Carya illinoinensis]